MELEEKFGFTNSHKEKIMKHAVINNETKKVVNIIIWDGAEWLPPRNHFVIRSDIAEIGDIWNEKDNSFVKDSSSMEKK